MSQKATVPAGGSELHVADKEGLKYKIKATAFTKTIKRQLKDQKIKDEKSKSSVLHHACVHASTAANTCVRLFRCSLMFDRRGVVAAASSIFKGKVIRALDVLCSVF